MSGGVFMSWLVTAAGVALIVCSIVVVFRVRVSPFMRFAPLAALVAYVIAAVLPRFLVGIAPILVVVIACFGLLIAYPYMLLRSPFGYVFAAVSVVFWTAALFVSVQYLARAHQ